MSFKKFLQDTGDFLGNDLKFGADMTLSALGADNVINQDSYKGSSKQGFVKASNIGGSIYKGLTPIATGAAGFAIGGPQGAQLGYMAGKGIQGIGNSVNPADARSGSEYNQSSQKTGNQFESGIGQFGQMGMSAMGMLGGMGGNGQQGQGAIPGMGTMYKYGGYNMYSNGGMQPNAEVEKQENTVAPDGEFTQYNGASHEQGGIPTNLKPGEMIFSDKLKLGKKTFADLNKVNNTNKEDKILKDIKSNNIAKTTAELMKQVKLKNSMALFNEQEVLKQNKLTNYAKRLGINLSSTNGSQEQFGNGGKKGDPRKVDKIPEGYIKGDIIDGKQTYYNQNNTPGDIQPANNGKLSNNPNQYFETMKTKVNNGINPKDLLDKGYIDENSYQKLKPLYNKDVVFTENTLQSPKQAEFTPATGQRTKIELLPSLSTNQPYQTYRIHNLNGQTNQSIDKHFTPTGQEIDLDKYMQSGDISKSLHNSGLTLEDYRKSNVRSEGTGETMPLNKIKGVDVMKINSTNTVQPNGYDQINNRAFKLGGMYPKYENGGDPIVDPAEEQAQFDMMSGLSDNRMQTGINGNNSTQSNNPNYGKILTQLGLGLSQNAGNLYDLKNAKNVEVEKYDRMTPSLLDSSAEEQYNNNQGKLAVEDLRNSSGGNASTYIQNRKDLALNQMLTNARIKQANDNANAQIKNGANQFNVNVDMMEKNANAMNRARAQDLKSNAYRQMGSNINNQYVDNQKTNSNNDMLKMIAMKNPQAANDPALLALFKKYGISY